MPVTLAANESPHAYINDSLINLILNISTFIKIYITYMKIKQKYIKLRNRTWGL